MRSIQETRALADLNPEFAAKLGGMKNEMEGQFGPWRPGSNIQMARQAVAMVYSIVRANRPKPLHLPYKTLDVNVPASDGTALPARVYTPRKPRAGGYPCMFVCQGGDYILSHIDTEATLCAAFASLGGVAIEVVYRPAPEHVFPTQIYDCYDGLQWVTRHFAGLNINPAKGFILAGETNGADIALALAHMYAYEDPQAPLTGLYISCPRAMEPYMVPEPYRDRFLSLEQNANAALLTTESLEFIRSAYKPDPSSPLAYPVLYPDHTRLPKTYFQVCGFDPSRDCGLVLEQIWRDCGIETRLDVYAGLPNAFWRILIHAAYTKQRSQKVTQGLTWLLGDKGCDWPEQAG